MEVKKETQENSHSPVLEDLYIDVCVTKSDITNSSMNLRSTTPPSGVLPPWEFSPVVGGQNGASIHIKPLLKSDDPASTTNSEYYLNVASQENPSPTAHTSSIHEWGQSYQWDYYSNFSQPGCSAYNLSSSLENNGSSQHLYRPSSTNAGQFTVCNVQQYDLELIRCSTPELINALASIQPDKEQTDPSENSSYGNSYAGHHTTSQNYHDGPERGNVSVVQEHGTSAMFMHLAQRYQDSGYSSDLCMSPVYPYDAKSRYSTKDRFRSELDEDKSVFVHNDVNLAQSVPKFSLSKSSSVSLTSIPSDKPYYHHHLHSHEKQIQSSDISSSDFTPSVVNHASSIVSHASSIVNHKITPKISVKPLPPVSSFRPQAPKRPSTTEHHRPSKKRAHLPSSAALCDDKKQRHNQPLNIHATEIMIKWYEAHRGNPYPSKSEKEKMAEEGGITVTQVKSWFANKRNRNNNTRPKVQKRQMTERLLDICHELARDAKHPSMNNADIIQKLSSIISNPPTEDDVSI